MGDGVADKSTVGHSCKIAKPGAVWIFVLHGLCHSEGEPGLAGSARTGDCHQTVVLHQPFDGARVNVAAHERCELSRQVTARPGMSLS